MSITNRQLLIILILLIAVITVGSLARYTYVTFKELSVASLNMAGIEAGDSLNRIPAKVTGVTSNIGNDYVTLNWNAITKSKLSGYRIYRTNSYEGQLIIGGSEQTSFTDYNVKSGETYYYRVSAINDLGEGYLSNPLRVIVR
jgi:fibronectin type 3 domain-containing protein